MDILSQRDADVCSQHICWINTLPDPSVLVFVILKSSYLPEPAITVNWYDDNRELGRVGLAIADISYA